MYGLNRQSIIEMKGFFKKQLQHLINEGLVKDDFDFTRNNINEKIRRLLKIKAIRKHYNEERDIFTYKIDKSIALEGYRLRNIEIISKYPRDEIKYFQYNNMLYGIPDGLYDTLSDIDKDIIEELIINISNNLDELKRIIIRFINLKYRGRLQRIVDLYNNSNLRGLVYGDGANKIEFMMAWYDEKDTHFDAVMSCLVLFYVIRHKNIIRFNKDVNNIKRELLSLIKKCGLSNDETREFYDKVFDIASFRLVMILKVREMSFSSFYHSHYIDDKLTIFEELMNL
jgi:hypothetical protein